MHKKNSIIGYTTGVFDMFHIGHLNILKQAKSNCDFLIVGLTTDKLCSELKGKEPVIPFYERKQIVESIKYVDKVIPQKKIDEVGDWKDIQFDTIFKGSDWKGSEKWNKLEQKFSKLGVQIKFFDYTKNTSSTELRKKIDSITF